MRKFSIISSLAGLAAGVLVVSLIPKSILFVSHDVQSEENVLSGQRYACAMMDFIGNKPGDCPVCGMKLQLVSAGEINDEQASRMGLQTSMIEEGPAHTTVRAYGAVRYDDRTARPIIARVAGRITKRHPAAMHMGNVIETDDPLYDLYSPEAYAAQSELAAAIKLGDIHSKSALMERFKRWNLLPLAQAIEAGSAPTDTVTIRSPFSGRVIVEEKADSMSKLPEVGEEVMADRILLRLVDPFSYMVVIHVPETRARWVREGQDVKLASDDYGELPDVEASVSWVSPELNLEIRAREVHLHLSDPEHKLLPGSLVNARFKVTLNSELIPADPQDENAVGKFPLIPKSAVLSTGTRHVAWKVADRKKDGRIRFELAPLALGPRIEDEFGNDRYVIRAGLKAGDEVATQGAFLIDSQAQLAGTESLLFPMGALAPAPSHSH